MRRRSPFGPQTHTCVRCFYSHTSAQVEIVDGVCWNMFGFYTIEANIYSFGIFCTLCPNVFGVVGRGGLRSFVGSWITMLASYIWRCLHGNVLFFLPVHVLLSLVSLCHISGCVSKKRYALGMPYKGVPLGFRKRVCPEGGDKGCAPTKIVL